GTASEQSAKARAQRRDRKAAPPPPRIPGRPAGAPAAGPPPRCAPRALRAGEQSPRRGRRRRAGRSARARRRRDGARPPAEPRAAHTQTAEGSSIAESPETSPPPPLRMVSEPSSSMVKDTGPRLEATRIGASPDRFERSVARSAMPPTLPWGGGRKPLGTRD